jgi:hypothetical protein
VPFKSQARFVYFVGDSDVHGPVTQEEWQIAIATVHSALGLPTQPDFVVDAFVDVRLTPSCRMPPRISASITLSERRPYRTATDLRQCLTPGREFVAKCCPACHPLVRPQLSPEAPSDRPACNRGSAQDPQLATERRAPV